MCQQSLAVVLASELLGTWLPGLIRIKSNPNYRKIMLRDHLGLLPTRLRLETELSCREHNLCWNEVYLIVYTVWTQYSTSTVYILCLCKLTNSILHFCIFDAHPPSPEILSPFVTYYLFFRSFILSNVRIHVTIVQSSNIS